MSATQASAPGKIILFGEHAVVYGQPALAVPVTQVQATATLTPLPPSPTGRGGRSEGIWIDARDVGRRYRLEDASSDDPLAAAIRLTFAHFNLPITDDSLRMTLESTIPIASGLGSGAAVCTALVRALANYLDHPLTNAEVSSIVFETEKLLHGTPSGIDNTVIAYGQPVYFVKGQSPIPFNVAHPFQLLIADTGLPSPTKITVGDVRAAREKEPERYEQMFRAIGDIAREARTLIEIGQTPGARFAETLGALMSCNHALLQQLGVSCPELDVLAECARAAGAAGAKLSGGGRGGNMLALVTPETESAVRAALEVAGAKRVIGTVVGE
jgi:mevalonate kinase